MRFSELREFQRERRRLSRKYRSLPTDLQLFREVIAAVPPTPSRRISILTQTPSLLIVKARWPAGICATVRCASSTPFSSMNAGLTSSNSTSRETQSARTTQGSTGICESVRMAGSLQLPVSVTSNFRGVAFVWRKHSCNDLWWYSLHTHSLVFWHTNYPRCATWISTTR